MKSFVSAVVVGAVLSANAFASRPLPKEVSPILVKNAVVKVASQGKVLKRNKMFPVETILVGLQAKVAPPNACTKFVGQQTVTGRIAPRGGARIAPPTTSIELMGAQDALIDGCIDIAPMPFDTFVSVEIRVNNEQPTVSPVSKLVTLNGKSYLVRLDPKTEQVSVTPVVH